MCAITNLDFVANQDGLALAPRHDQHASASCGNKRVPMGIARFRRYRLHGLIVFQVDHHGRQQIGRRPGLPESTARPDTKRLCRCAAGDPPEIPVASRSCSMIRSRYCGSTTQMGRVVKQSDGSSRLCRNTIGAVCGFWTGRNWRRSSKPGSPLWKFKHRFRGERNSSEVGSFRFWHRASLLVDDRRSGGEL